MPTLDELALDSGCFAMIAMDQRESLRQMLADADREHADTDLVDVKLAVADELAGAASGFLIDGEFGFGPVLRSGALPPRCGLILATDLLDQPSGAPVQDTGLDEDLLQAAAASARTCAAKLLIMWKEDSDNDRRVGIAERFVTRCRELGLISVLEGVAVVADEHGLNGAIRDAARELGGLAPDLYKAQVPGHGLGTDAELDAACAGLAAVLTVPWVVLSNGVPLAEFPRGVEAACRAGASGMLAGRALWSDALSAPDLGGYLRAHCLPRLDRLVRIVNANARPWSG
jgi:sulfofructosephosphate aldolase